MPSCNRCHRVEATADMRRSPSGGWICRDKDDCKIQQEANALVERFGREPVRRAVARLMRDAERRGV